MSNYTLRLSKDGVFPITKDKDGNNLPFLPSSGFSFPGTIQGEGKLNGVPSLFIRLAGCNLNCCWKDSENRLIPCDSAYASYKIKDEYTLPIEEVFNIVVNNTKNIHHLVITGGEPFLQSASLEKLCQLLKEYRNYHITIESNTTIFNEKVAHYTNLFSLSPKLNSSINNISLNTERINIPVIQNFISYALNNQRDFQLKFVYANENDIQEIKSILSELNGWKNEDILLMPLGYTSDLLKVNSQKVLEHCILNGWRYCERLHISLFGAKDGV